MQIVGIEGLSPGEIQDQLRWWGFPFGLIYTPMCIIQNLSGGKDVTAEVSPMFRLAAPVERSDGLPPASFPTDG